MSSTTIALVMAITFTTVVVCVYIGLVLWRRFLVYRYGNRELLVNDLEFDTNDLRHFEFSFGAEAAVCVPAPPPTASGLLLLLVAGWLRLERAEALELRRTRENDDGRGAARDAQSDLNGCVKNELELFRYVSKFFTWIKDTRLIYWVLMRGLANTVKLMEYNRASSVPRGVPSPIHYWYLNEREKRRGREALLQLYSLLLHVYGRMRTHLYLELFSMNMTSSWSSCNFLFSLTLSERAKMALSKDKQACAVRAQVSSSGIVFAKSDKSARRKKKDNKITQVMKLMDYCGACFLLPCCQSLRDCLEARRSEYAFDYVKYAPLTQEVNSYYHLSLSLSSSSAAMELSSVPTVRANAQTYPEIKAQLRRLLSRTDTIEDEIDGSTLASISHKLNSVGSNSGIGAAADLVKRASSSSTSTSSRSRSKSSSASPEPIISSPTPQNSTAATAVATTQQQQHSRSNGSCSDASDLEALIPAAKMNSKDEEHKWEPLGSDASKRPTNPPRFEAYMMTGDLMLNLSRTQQTSGLLPKQKKVDSLRYSNHANTHHHHRHHHHHHHHHHHQNNHHNNNNNNNDEAHHHHHQHNNHQQAQESPPQQQQHNSVPTSPSVGQQQQPHRRSGNSASSSPVKLNRQESGCSNDGGSSGHASFVRTSRSEDQLQIQKDPAMLAAELEMDEDVASSLNTLLDTRPSADQQPGEERPEGDRIVWTYNAPAGGVVGGGGDPQQQQQQPCHSSSSFGDASSSSSSSSSSSCSHPNSHTSCSQSSSSNGGGSGGSSSSSSTEASSPQRSLSPASPTSVSSSVMSSNSGSRRFPVPGNATTTHQNQTQQQPQQQQQQQQQQLHHSSSAPKQQVNGELSQSEVISNMSSPDYNDEETMDILSARDNMMVSDPSDSDSTILASEPPQRRVSKQQKKQHSASTTEQTSNEQQHRIIIQVKGPNGGTANSNSNCANSNNSPRGGRRRLGSAGPDSIPPITNNPPVQHSPPVQHRDCYYQELHEDEQHHTSPPHSADEESDIESLHSYHYSPKAVDMPSAIRLAKRLYSLDGFKKSDVSRHLSKKYSFLIFHVSMFICI
ncbi:unnamed protein product [Trichogramma brassicae]|uniref:Uncharacterized protein n=1 Tax=Trichogramma brassicae TaxID=86971 RepID=A0A6H5J3T3_9HYME|nr:unnamed protein product [Trichogramma brassicae]